MITGIRFDPLRALAQQVESGMGAVDTVRETGTGRVGCGPGKVRSAAPRLTSAGQAAGSLLHVAGADRRLLERWPCWHEALGPAAMEWAGPLASRAAAVVGYVTEEFGQRGDGWPERERMEAVEARKVRGLDATRAALAELGGNA